MSGASQAVGVLALNRALIYPSTAVVNVIAASNSIVVLLLNWILLGLVPGTPKIIGNILSYHISFKSRLLKVCSWSLLEYL